MTNCSRRMLVAGGLALSLLAGGAVQAEDTRARAKALIRSGDTNYRLAKFEEALADYSAALKLRNHPAIVFNIAQCYRQVPDHKKALFYYKLYLSDWERKKPGTKPPYEEEVNGHIAALTSKVEQEQAARAARQRQEQEAERKRKEAELARTRARQQTPAPTTAPASVPVDDGPPPARRSKVWLTAGIVTAVAAAGMLGMGVAFDLESQGERHGSDAWADAANMGLSGYVAAGGLAVASGVCWFLYARSGKPPPVAAIAPLPGGVALTGTFQF